MAKLSKSADDLLAEMREAIEAEHPGVTRTREWDPLVEMAVCAADPALPKAMRFSANKEIAQYIYPKRKSVEVDAKGSGVPVLLAQFVNGQFVGVINAERDAGREYAGEAVRQALTADDDEGDHEVDRH